MVLPLALAGLGLQALSIGLGMSASKKAKKAALKAARAQAALTYEQRREEIRLAQQSRKQQLSAARSATFASNLQMSGTPKAAVDALGAESLRGINYQKYAAELERKAILSGARGAGASLKAGAVSDALGLGADLLSSGIFSGGGGGSSVSPTGLDIGGGLQDITPASGLDVTGGAFA